MFNYTEVVRISSGYRNLNLFMIYKQKKQLQIDEIEQTFMTAYGHEKAVRLEKILLEPQVDRQTLLEHIYPNILIDHANTLKFDAHNDDTIFANT